VGGSIPPVPPNPPPLPLFLAYFDLSRPGVWDPGLLIFAQFFVFLQYIVTLIRHTKSHNNRLLSQKRGECITRPYFMQIILLSLQ